MYISESLPFINFTPVILKTFLSIYSRWRCARNLILGGLRFLLGLKQYQFRWDCVFSGGNCYKPIRVNNFWSKNYIEYEINDDSN